MQEKTLNGDLTVEKVPGKENPSDMFTKETVEETLARCMKMLPLVLVRGLVKGTSRGRQVTFLLAQGLVGALFAAREANGEKTLER